MLPPADLASSASQCEKGSREATLRDGQRWLDQAQGQLQNTQVALNDKEAECRELATCLEEAAEQATFFEVGMRPAAEVALLRSCTDMPLSVRHDLLGAQKQTSAYEACPCTGLP